jgi:hypothetical protein
MGNNFVSGQVLKDVYKNSFLIGTAVTPAITSGTTSFAEIVLKISIQ